MTTERSMATAVIMLLVVHLTYLICLSTGEGVDMQSESSASSSSSLYVRQSSGLVREASVLDAIIFNAVFSAPVGATLAFGILYALGLFPGADMVLALVIAFVVNIPVCIMMSMMAQSGRAIGMRPRASMLDWQASTSWPAPPRTRSSRARISASSSTRKNFI